MPVLRHSHDLPDALSVTHTHVTLRTPSSSMQYVPSATASTLTVGVRVRPLIRAEIAKGGRKDIIRVIDGRVVIVLDPDENKVGLCSRGFPWGGLPPRGRRVLF